jgi:hypothetical protein
VSSVAHVLTEYVGSLRPCLAAPVPRRFLVNVPRRATGIATPQAQLALMLGAFALGTVVAGLAGAELGTACAFGQMAFAAALVGVVLRAP